MSTGKKLAVVFGGYAVILIAIGLIFGSDGKNDEFQPQNEFKLDSWIGIHIGGIDLSVNKAVLYIVLAPFALGLKVLRPARKGWNRAPGEGAPVPHAPAAPEDLAPSR